MSIFWIEKVRTLRWTLLPCMQCLISIQAGITGPCYCYNKLLHIACISSKMWNLKQAQYSKNDWKCWYQYDGKGSLFTSMSILQPQSLIPHFNLSDVEEVWTFYLCTVYMMFLLHQIFIYISISRSRKKNGKQSRNLLIKPVTLGNNLMFPLPVTKAIFKLNHPLWFHNIL